MFHTLHINIYTTYCNSTNQSNQIPRDTPFKDPDPFSFTELTCESWNLDRVCFAENRQPFHSLLSHFT